MTTTEPRTELDARYSDEGATATPWREGERRLEAAELYWITTIRPDGRLHATPTIAVWRDAALYFCTGPDEQKAKNLAGNPRCLLITGCNQLREGFDLIVEADAVRVTDDVSLRGIADAFEAKYGPEWHFDVGDGAFHHDQGQAWVFEVAPATVYGFGKGDYSHTRWRF